MRIGIVAGEPSGDFLAAQLIKSIRKNRPDVGVEGIGGERLFEAGCEILFPMEKLAVMGLVEVLGKVWELRVLRAKLADHFINNPPDVFIGVDSPDFNLGLERTLRKKGIKTIHYVCPTVWAWRTWRVRKIRKAADLVLSVFPFEAEFFRRHHIPISYVGHPLAGQVDLQPDAESARRRLGLSAQVLTVAVLPGSRSSELDSMTGPFVETAAWMDARYDEIQFVANVVDETAEKRLSAAAKSRGLQLKIVKNRIGDTLAAADVALVASGTVTLEAMLHKVPMVVAYRMHSLTFWIVRALLKVKYVSLPNLLANRKLVPEYFQSDCRAGVLGPALQYWLESPDNVRTLTHYFTHLHISLQRADESAAQAVLRLADPQQPHRTQGSQREHKVKPGLD